MQHGTAIMLALFAGSCIPHLAMTSTIPSDAEDEHERWTRADYYFNTRTRDEKNSAYNDRLRFIGSSLRLASAITAGILASYKTHHYLTLTAAQIADPNQQQLPHTCIGWLEKGLNPVANFTIKKLVQWFGNSVADAPDAPPAPLFTRTRLTIGTAAGLGIATFIATYKLLGMFGNNLNRDRSVDLGAVRSAIESVDEKYGNREFAASLPPSIRRDLRIALGEGRRLSNEAALALLAKIRERIEDYFAENRATALNPQMPKPTRAVGVVTR